MSAASVNTQPYACHTLNDFILQLLHKRLKTTTVRTLFLTAYSGRAGSRFFKKVKATIRE